MRRSSGARAGTRPSARLPPPTTRRCAPSSPQPSGSTSSIAERRPVAPVPCARAARARLRHADAHGRRSGCRRACGGERRRGHARSGAHVASWRAPCALRGGRHGSWTGGPAHDGHRLGTRGRDRPAAARRAARRARTEAERAALALTALARSHNDILAATEQAPSVGTRSWGRRFTVTKYLPRSPKYGRFNHGITATLTKADPAARIVAVDPKLIPYGSWVWIEGLGWFRAEDCGAAIKGFRLDVLTPTEEEAMAFGKQDRFAIVVPPANA